MILSLIFCTWQCDRNNSLLEPVNFPVSYRATATWVILGYSVEGVWILTSSICHTRVWVCVPRFNRGTSTQSCLMTVACVFCLQRLESVSVWRTCGGRMRVRECVSVCACVWMIPVNQCPRVQTKLDSAKDISVEKGFFMKYLCHFWTEWTILCHSINFDCRKIIDISIEKRFSF